MSKVIPFPQKKTHIVLKKGDDFIFSASQEPGGPPVVQYSGPVEFAPLVGICYLEGDVWVPFVDFDIDTETWIVRGLSEET